MKYYRTPIEHLNDSVQLSKIKDFPSCTRKEYEAATADLSFALLQLQRAFLLNNKRAVIVFEGTDSSGKGGAIKRISEFLDPRGLKVWPIGAPNNKERGHHYLQRFWTRLPDEGSWAIFDRSWYGRVLVERVEELCEVPEWQRAFEEINEFENMLVDDGIPVIKMFLHITEEEQKKRFKDRLCNPSKRFKITLDDFKAHKKWDNYQQAMQDMLDETHTKKAPWHVIPANSKPYARLTVINTILKALGENVDYSKISLINEDIIKEAEKLWGKKIVGEIKNQS